MCSTHPQRIAEIGKAIDDFAEQALAAPSQYLPPSSGGQAEGSADTPDAAHDSSSRSTGTGQGGKADRRADVSDTDHLVLGLAQLWAQLAELDPEVARRLSKYQV